MSTITRTIKSKEELLALFEERGYDKQLGWACGYGTLQGEFFNINMFKFCGKTVSGIDYPYELNYLMSASMYNWMEEWLEPENPIWIEEE